VKEEVIYENTIYVGIIIVVILLSLYTSVIGLMHGTDLRLILYFGIFFKIAVLVLLLLKSKHVIIGIKTLAVLTGLGGALQVMGGLMLYGMEKAPLNYTKLSMAFIGVVFGLYIFFRCDEAIKLRSTVN